MNNTQEFDSLEHLISEDDWGFTIIHQEPALGNEWQEEEFAATSQRLKQHSTQTRSQLEALLGEPSDAYADWEVGVPTWASAGGYALWKRTESFITIFISWDNPEDPSFVIVAKAAIADFDNDHMNPQPDHWDSKWMTKSEW